MVENPPAMQEVSGSIPGLGRSPGEGNGNPLQYSCLKNPMDKEAHGLLYNLMGYNPRSCKKSDKTERLNIHKCGKYYNRAM